MNSLFYTGKGDKGKSYVGKKKIDKACNEVEALGALDELNSLLGAIKSKHISKEIKMHLHDIQEKLFIIQAQIAAIMLSSKHKAPTINKRVITMMEKTLRALEKKISPARKFIIPGGDEAAALLDYARALARKAEREVVKITKKKKVHANTLAYLNRLSSMLFALARYQNKKKRVKEQHPKYK